jgi:hypothetical protein
LPKELNHLGAIARGSMLEATLDEVEDVIDTFGPEEAAVFGSLASALVKEADAAYVAGACLSLDRLLSRERRLAMAPSTSRGLTTAHCFAIVLIEAYLLRPESGDTDNPLLLRCMHIVEAARCRGRPLH